MLDIKLCFSSWYFLLFYELLSFFSVRSNFRNKFVIRCLGFEPPLNIHQAGNSSERKHTVKRTMASISSLKSWNEVHSKIFFMYFIHAKVIDWAMATHIWYRNNYFHAGLVVNFDVNITYMLHITFTWHHHQKRQERQQGEWNRTLTQNWQMKIASEHHSLVYVGALIPPSKDEGYAFIRDGLIICLSFAKFTILTIMLI